MRKYTFYFGASTSRLYLRVHSFNWVLVFFFFVFLLLNFAVLLLYNNWLGYNIYGKLYETCIHGQINGHTGRADILFQSAHLLSRAVGRLIFMLCQPRCVSGCFMSCVMAHWNSFLFICSIGVFRARACVCVYAADTKWDAANMLLIQQQANRRLKHRSPIH